MRGGLSEVLEGQDGNAQDMLFVYELLMVQLLEDFELVLETEDEADPVEEGEEQGQPIDIGEDEVIFGDEFGVEYEDGILGCV
jgi:hypothetical protein